MRARRGAYHFLREFERPNPHKPRSPSRCGSPSAPAGTPYNGRSGNRRRFLPDRQAFFVTNGECAGPYSGGSIPHPMQSLCTLRDHCRQWPRNTSYQADATPYLDRTFTGWIAPTLRLAHLFDRRRGAGRVGGNSKLSRLRRPRPQAHHAI